MTVARLPSESVFFKMSGFLSFTQTRVKRLLKTFSAEEMQAEREADHLPPHSHMFVISCLLKHRQLYLAFICGND
jgi:hypothetical protein